jgi:hypothetical protein
MRLGVTVVLALILAGSAQAATRYRIQSVTASARFAFTSGDINSFVNGSAVMELRGKSGAVVALSSSGGRVVTAVRGGITERVRLGSRPDVTQPYVENTCGTRRAVSGQGGLLLRRSGRGRLELRWAFPQAATAFCPGPRVGALRSVTGRMKATLAASRIGARRLVLRLSGRAAVKGFTVNGQGGTGTYSWRAAITLVRL